MVIRKEIYFLKCSLVNIFSFSTLFLLFFDFSESCTACTQSGTYKKLPISKLEFIYLLLVLYRRLLLDPHN